jgi:hypothetical protein
MELLLSHSIKKIGIKWQYLLPGSLLLLALILRIGHVLSAPPLSGDIWSDMKIYVGISQDISAGIWKTTHFFQSIGYPLLISWLRQPGINLVLVLELLQAFASTFILFFMYRLVSSSFGMKTGLISLAIGSIHLPWILFTNFALPEIFFTFFLSICAWMTFLICVQQNNRFLPSFVWGLAFILAFWLKGTHALWGPLFFLGLIWSKKTAALKPIIIIGCVVSFGLMAHGYLTYAKTGKIQLSASTSGLNFIEGKCPSKRNIDSLGYTWLSPLYFQLGIDQSKTWKRPFTESGYYFRKGLQCIKHDPFVLIQSFESIPYLFYGNHMWPFNRKSYARYTRLYDLVFVLFSVIGLAAYWINFKFSKNEFIIWTLPILSLFLCVYIFKSEIRYRVPYDIWIIPLGVKGWLTMFDKRRLS